MKRKKAVEKNSENVADGIQFAVLVTNEVVLLGYPKLDKPFTYYSQGRTYQQFMTDMGYVLYGKRGKTKSFRIPNTIPRERKVVIEACKDKALRSMIVPKAKLLILRNTQKERDLQ